MKLVLETSDWKGSAQIRLGMPMRGRRDTQLESGHRLLCREDRLAVLAYFFGYCKGDAETGALQDFERRLPDGRRYGVADGVPFPQPWPDAEDDEDFDDEDPHPLPASRSSVRK